MIAQRVLSRTEKFCPQPRKNGLPKSTIQLPFNAVQYCLVCGIRGGSGYVAFYDKPFIKFERLLETYWPMPRRNQVFLESNACLDQAKAMDIGPH